MSICNWGCSQLALCGPPPLVVLLCFPVYPSPAIHTQGICFEKLAFWNKIGTPECYLRKGVANQSCYEKHYWPWYFLVVKDFYLSTLLRFSTASKLHFPKLDLCSITITGGF
jgi:hypothetical protein